MRLIRKDYSTEVVRRHEAELQAQQLDEQSLLNPNVYPGLTGRKLWKMVRDIQVIPHLWDLKHQMYEEQGGICCYCGLRIFEDSEGRKQSVEHLVPKGTHRELVGEYKNLLLTCSITDDDANLMGVATNNPTLKHCDDSKANKPLHYTPLMPECETAFQYDAVGGVQATADQAQSDIETLRLDCDLLKKRRQEALSILFDKDGNFVSEEELRKISTDIMSRDENNRLSEFCFVIKNVAESLIPPQTASSQ